MEIWNLIVQTNTFNFIIFVAIFAVIIKYAKVGALIEGLQKKIFQSINLSDEANEKSLKELDLAKQKVNMVGSEIKVILDDADLTAIRLTRKIMADASIQAEIIKNSAQKVIDSEGKYLMSELTQNTALASVKLAKRHIQRTLAEKPYYHAKFIEDSINEIDRFDF